MTQANTNRISLQLTLLLCLTLAGCGGTKILKEPEPMQVTQALAIASDQQLNASLDWVIVRDGPGTWARNADWDEYLLTVGNQSDVPMTIKRVTVVDSLQTSIASIADRKPLVKGTKATAKRYKKSGIKVRAGAGGGSMLVAGAAVTALGVGVGSAAATGAIMSGGATMGGAGAAAGGLLLIGPALVVGGIVRGVRNSAVDEEIGNRQSDLPLVLAANEQLNLVQFYPVSPSPVRVEVVYSNASGDHVLTIDTAASLHGLHFSDAK